jgi:hypothetical protein
MTRAVIVAGFVASSLAAEPPELPNEFAITDSIVMTDADEFYVSPNVAYFRLPDEKRLSVATELAYGLSDRFQLAAEIPYEFSNPDRGRTVDGIGDVELKARYGVIDYRKQPFGLDLGVGVITPTGDRGDGLGDGRVEIEPSFTASQWIGPVNVELNLAWQRAISDAGDEPKNEYEYNIALVYPIRHLFLIVEGNGETTRERTKYYITPELVWKATEHVELRLAAAVGLTRAAGDFGVIAGCTVEFEHLFSRNKTRN